MERSVIGAILAGHRQVGELLELIKPEDFFDRRHKRIVGVLSLHAAGKRPDLLAVHDELVQSNEGDAAGGVVYLASLLDGIALQGDTLYVLRGQRRMASFREAVHLAETIKNLAIEQAGSIEGLLDSAVEKFSNLAPDLENTDDDGTPYFDSASEALSVARQGAALKIYTDINKLDQWTGGFREGERRSG